MQDGPLGRGRLLAKASVVVAITPRLVQWPASASACAEKASARVFVVGVAAFSSLGLEIGRCCFVRRADGAIGQYRPKVTEHHLTGDGVSVRVGDGDARYDTDRPSRSTAARGVGKEGGQRRERLRHCSRIGLALAKRRKGVIGRCIDVAPRIRRLRPHGRFAVVPLRLEGRDPGLGRDEVAGIRNGLGIRHDGLKSREIRCWSLRAYWGAPAQRQ